MRARRSLADLPANVNHDFGRVTRKRSLLCTSGEAVLMTFYFAPG